MIGEGESCLAAGRQLPNLTEEEAERKWMEGSLRPKGDAKEQANQPGEKAAASLTIKFDIPGAEAVAKVAVRNVAMDEYIGTEELWKEIHVASYALDQRRTHRYFRAISE